MEAGNVRVPLARSNCLSAAFFDGKLGQWPNTLVLYNDIYSIVKSILTQYSNRDNGPIL